MSLHECIGMAASSAQNAESGLLPEEDRLAIEAVSSPCGCPGEQPVETVIATFRTALKEVQSSELDRLYCRLPDLDEHSRRAIWYFADGLVSRMMQPPLESICEETRNASRQRLADALRRLFQLPN